ncbi:hypothetical protein ACFO0N_18420 [Halobium salinum]|uniref:Uncharacterized protein n=1 Tax=Halobium salinum TaxID=1364940 RepID=A0ABD5PGL0_9EURY|nr:hypothetical protein [Halobium salinum]
MAARPPQNSDSEPEAVAFGIAALAGELDDAAVEFPTTADHLVASLDDPSIPYNASGNGVALSAALGEVPRDRFDTKRDLLDALHPVFEERRRSGGGSVVGRLRGMLPF